MLHGMRHCGVPSVKLNVRLGRHRLAMSANPDPLRTRFHLNMNRINGLVQLLFSHDPLKPPTLFGNSSGARADILRAIVVFLHATFVKWRSEVTFTSQGLA